MAEMRFLGSRRSMRSSRSSAPAGRSRVGLPGNLVSRNPRKPPRCGGCFLMRL